MCIHVDECLYMCVSAFLWVCRYVCERVGVFVCAYGGQRLTLGVLSLCPLFLREGLSLNLLVGLDWLSLSPWDLLVSAQPVPGFYVGFEHAQQVIFILGLTLWIFNTTPFYMGLGIQTQVLMLVSELCQLSHHLPMPV